MAGGNHDKHVNKEQPLSTKNSDQDVVKSQTKFSGSFMAGNQSALKDPFGKPTPGFTNRSTYESPEPVLQNLQRGPTRKARVALGQTPIPSNFANGQKPSYGAYRYFFLNKHYSGRHFTG